MTESPLPPMHIGFDISQTGKHKAGCGYYAHAMLQAMMQLAPNNQYSLYTSFGDFYFDPELSHSNPYPQGTISPHHKSKQAAAQFWLHPNLESQLQTPHLIHANNYWCPTQAFQTTRLVYTLYDLSYILHPEWTTEENRLGCFEGVFRASVSADWIVAISEATRQDFLSCFPHFPSERIEVIYPASRFTDRNMLGKPPPALEGFGAHSFWLNVGTIEPRKNQINLLEAYHRYLMQGGDPKPLVLAGGQGWMMNDFAEQIKRYPALKHRVILTDYVSDEELIWLYRHCYANLYPSHFEGFGLPVLEGMQFAAPTISSNSSSLPEITQEAAISLSPHDIEAWTQAMLTLSRSPQQRATLSQQAETAALKFHWKRTTEKLIQLYQRAMRQPKRVASHKDAHEKNKDT